MREYLLDRGTVTRGNTRIHERNSLASNELLDSICVVDGGIIADQANVLPPLIVILSQFAGELCQESREYLPRYWSHNQTVPVTASRTNSAQESYCLEPLLNIFLTSAILMHPGLFLLSCGVEPTLIDLDQDSLVFF